MWSKNEEKKFFKYALKITSHEKLFYKVGNRYLAYWPKSYRGYKTTLQSRNSYVGDYTEKWLASLLHKLIPKKLYVIQSAVCPEIGLTSNSPADIVISKSKETKQNPEDILLIVEVKMSIVWNWEYFPESKEIKCIGDFTSHTGNPSLLRSDSMLKAIGKCINIRVSDKKASHISLIVVGNTPVSKSYYKKVDRLNKTGIIQKFLSVNPKPTDNENSLNIKYTHGKGFIRVDTEKELKEIIMSLLNRDKVFFSGMTDMETLGKIVKQAAYENSYEDIAKKFLDLLEKS